LKSDFRGHFKMIARPEGSAKLVGIELSDHGNSAGRRPADDRLAPWEDVIAEVDPLAAYPELLNRIGSQQLVAAVDIVRVSWNAQEQQRSRCQGRRCQRPRLQSSQFRHRLLLYVNSASAEDERSKFVVMRADDPIQNCTHLEQFGLRFKQALQ
jgi:hypothetical protein